MIVALRNLNKTPTGMNSYDSTHTTYQNSSVYIQAERKVFCKLFLNRKCEKVIPHIFYAFQTGLT